MAITVVALPDTLGGDGTVDLVAFQKIQRALGQSGPEGIVETGNGLACTATGTRGIRVDSGELMQNGLLFANSAAATVTCAANGTGNPRLDLVVAQTVATSTKTAGGSIVVVQGTPAASPVLPALTRTLGGTWQTPLCVAQIDPSASSAIVTDARPKPRGEYVYNGTQGLQTIPSPGTAELSQFAQPLTIPDPGWPYRLRIAARVNAAPSSTGNGFTVCTVYVNGNAVSDGRSDKGGNIPASALVKTTAVFTGSSLVVVTLKTSAWPAEACTPAANFTDCNVTVVPA